MNMGAARPSSLPLLRACLRLGSSEERTVSCFNVQTHPDRAHGEEGVLTATGGPHFMRPWHLRDRLLSWEQEVEQKGPGTSFLDYNQNRSGRQGPCPRRART